MRAPTMVAMTSLSPAPRPLALFVTGTLFTVLFLAAPLAHQVPRASARDVLLLVAPAIVLLIALARPLPVLIYGLFPVSHLPLVVLRPELVSPTVYPTAWPLLAVVAAGAAYVAAASRRLAPKVMPTPGPRDLWVLVASALVALGPLIALILPALRRDVEPQTAALVAVLGPLASWYAVARLVPRLVLPPLLSSAAHAEAWHALAPPPPSDGAADPRARAHRRAFLVAALLAAVALGLAAAWYVIGPPPPNP
ncbi:MAG: hypothetical protein IT385_11960 [Deltaproteobacteria bacterium]|nr:hypothetical protein [Deltaproteobacteria bacterium]